MKPDVVRWLDRKNSLCDARGVHAPQLWGTAYHASEIQAASRYPNQSGGGDGLPALDCGGPAPGDTDIVAGVASACTISRPEDKPLKGILSKPLSTL
jgi:Cu2+-containing amine oxidase